MTPPVLAECDYVVVGGGSAGCALAARLSEDPATSVVLLEAGPDVRTLDDLPGELRHRSVSGGGIAAPAVGARTTDLVWRYRVELVPETAGMRSAEQVRGRVLGGSSSVNGANFPRGLPEDYDGWGTPMWTWRRVLQSFRRLETDLDYRDELHGADGPIPVWRPRLRELPAFHAHFYEAALRAGFPEKPDLNHPDGSGIGPAIRCDVDGERMSTAVAYVTPARHRLNLSVRANATARRILFDGPRATGVEVKTADGIGVIRAAETILAAGVFGSPQLLLCSGVGPADMLRSAGVPLRHALDGVGSNLRCNPSINVPTTVEPTVRDPEAERPQVFLVYGTRSSAGRNEMSLMPRQVGERQFVQCQLRAPESVGDLSIVGPDPATSPKIRYGYLDREDLRRLREAIADTLEIGASGDSRLGLARRRSDERLTDSWIVSHVHTPFHASGTCRMGPSSDPGAVVDDQCRVNGIDGLRVVDLSITPRPVRAGPAATAVMIGEHVANILRGAQRYRPVVPSPIDPGAP